MSDPGLVPSPGADRGVNRVSGRAARRLVEGILAHRCPGVIDPDVDVGLDERNVGQGEVRIGISLALTYPEGPLAATLAAVREAVADEVARSLGRPASRIDLVVTRLISGEAPVSGAARLPGGARVPAEGGAEVAA